MFYIATMLLSNSSGQSMNIESTQIIYLLIGAGLGLLGSLGVLVIERWLKNWGQVRIYRKIVFLEGFNISLEVKDNELYVPVRLEIINTKSSSVLLRNIVLLLVNSDGKGFRMTQIEKNVNNNSGKVITYGIEKSYSVVIPDNSVRTFEFMFRAKRSDENEVFNKIQLEYIDIKNKSHNVPFIDYPDGWNTSGSFNDVNWVELKL